MITVYFNRKTGEAFATDNDAYLRKELFDSGARDPKDFETATASGLIQIKKHDNGRLNVTTLNDPYIL